MLKNVVRRTPTRCVRDDGWRLPDGLWAKMERLLPARPEHPLGCHNPRVPDRAAMDAIFFVLHTGCQWNALRETTICSSSSAHRRFQEWVRCVHECWVLPHSACNDTVMRRGERERGGGRNRRGRTWSA